MFSSQEGIIHLGFTQREGADREELSPNVITSIEFTLSRNEATTAQKHMFEELSQLKDSLKRFQIKIPFGKEFGFIVRAKDNRDVFISLRGSQSGLRGKVSQDPLSTQLVAERFSGDLQTIRVVYFDQNDAVEDSAADQKKYKASRAYTEDAFAQIVALQQELQQIVEGDRSSVAGEMELLQAFKDAQKYFRDVFSSGARLPRKLRFNMIDGSFSTDELDGEAISSEDVLITLQELDPKLALSEENIPQVSRKVKVTIQTNPPVVIQIDAKVNGWRGLSIFAEESESTFRSDRRKPEAHAIPVKIISKFVTPPFTHLKYIHADHEQFETSAQGVLSHASASTPLGRIESDILYYQPVSCHINRTEIKRGEVLVSLDDRSDALELHARADAASFAESFTSIIRVNPEYVRATETPTVKRVSLSNQWRLVQTSSGSSGMEWFGKGDDSVEKAMLMPTVEVEIAGMDSHPARTNIGFVRPFDIDVIDTLNIDAVCNDVSRKVEHDLFWLTKMRNLMSERAWQVLQQDYPVVYEKAQALLNFVDRVPVEYRTFFEERTSQEDVLIIGDDVELPAGVQVGYAILHQDQSSATQALSSDDRESSEVCRRSVPLPITSTELHKKAAVAEYKFVRVIHHADFRRVGGSLKMLRQATVLWSDDAVSASTDPNLAAATLDEVVVNEKNPAILLEQIMSLMDSLENSAVGDKIKFIRACIENGYILRSVLQRPRGVVSFNYGDGQRIREIVFSYDDHLTLFTAEDRPTVAYSENSAQNKALLLYDLAKILKYGASTTKQPFESMNVFQHYLEISSLILAIPWTDWHGYFASLD